MSNISLLGMQGGHIEEVVVHEQWRLEAGGEGKNEIFK
jgi:hypothetical protein